MSNAARALISAARAHFGIVCVPTCSLLSTRQFNPSHTHPMKTDLISSSPMPTLQNGAVADRVVAVYLDDGVRRAAGRCADALMQLLDAHGPTSEVSRIIDLLAPGEIESLTPALVVERLQQRLEEIAQLGSSAKADGEVHQQAVTRARDRHRPLHTAVANALNNLILERDSIYRALDARKRMGGFVNSSRYDTLKAAGLTNEQIGQIEPSALEANKAAAIDQRLT